MLAPVALLKGMAETETTTLPMAYTTDRLRIVLHNRGGGGGGGGVKTKDHLITHYCINRHETHCINCHTFHKVNMPYIQQ